MIRKVLPLLLLSLVSVLSFAKQEQLKPSTQLTISEGLPHNGITSILEDSKGYLWIGTFDGLSRYDGYGFTTFRNQIDEKKLISNRIRSLFEDSKGNIWIGTDDGISLYEYEMERFVTIYENPNTNGPYILNIFENTERQEIVCISQHNGLLIFDNTYRLKHIHYLPKTISAGKVEFSNGLIIDSGRYFISSPNGLYTYNPERGTFHHILEGKVSNSYMPLKANDSTLLVCSPNGISVITYLKQDNKYAFRLERTNLKGINIRHAAIDYNNNLWVGTFRDGFIKINDVNNFIEGKKITTHNFNLKAKLVRTSFILPTESKGCWIGTFNKGLYRFDTKVNPFKYYNSELGLENSLQSDEILHLTPYDNKRFFVSAHTGGIGLFNFKTGIFDPIPFQYEENIRTTGAIHLDNNKNIWLKEGARLGLCRLNKSHTIPVKIESKEFPFVNKLSNRAMVQDKMGYLWFGGEEGLYRVKVNHKNKVLSAESIREHEMFANKHQMRIRHLYIDPLYRYLWVGTKDDGLFRITTRNDSKISDLPIKEYINEDGSPILPSVFVSAVIRLPNADLWVATERGGFGKLIETENEKTTFVGFTEKDGLSNNVIKSIQYDNDMNLWISTNVGLNKFNTKDNTFRIFNKEDGLPFIDFNNSGAKMKDGTLLFSGFDGFIYFHPKDIPDEEDLPSVEFSRLKLSNNIVYPGDTINGRILLKKRLADLSGITLKHHEKVFTIEVNALHFSTTINHKLRYQLLPINKEWIKVSSDQRELNYNALPPGKYTLRVMASNSLGKWTEPKELKITIKAPYWKTGLAFFIYFALTILLIYVVMKLILKFQTLNHNLEIEHLEKEQGKEVNAAKLRFFSNISHEIKTPITLISGPVNALSDRFKHHPDVSEKLDIVKRQSRKISQLVDQVHDFQRSDAGQLKMNFSNFNFDSFIKEVKDDFSFLAENEGKILKIDRQKEDIFVNADEDKLNKIFNNLLSNAFKFTNKEDEITIEYYQHENNLIVNVKDGGKGIDSNDLPHVFERFFQSKKMKKEYSGGSGIGLAFSKRLVEMHYGFISVDSVEGHGTTMTVKLPIIIEKTEEIQRLSEEQILKSEKDFVSTKMVQDKEKIAQIKVDETVKESTIFLAEDNTDMRLFVSETLSHFFNVKSFVNGQECLTAMEKEWPDLVVSDVLMPEMNGFDLTRAIKSDIKTSHIPVILLTACTVIDDQIKGIREGADAYILKPFDTEHLVARIELLLQARTKLRQRFEANLPLHLKDEEDSGKDVIFLEKLYQLMSDNLGNLELDLNQFARELYLNRTHFYQKVKALTNQTPFELLKNYRLKKAAELLLNEKLPVNEVIDATGFKSRSHFIKSFKERYNTTPGKYAQGVEEGMNSKD